MPLNELENYLQTNKHLPNVPSAKEVEKDGYIKMGELSFKQLEKTEELYLYIIEMNKKIEKLEKENLEMKGTRVQEKN